MIKAVFALIGFTILGVVAFALFATGYGFAIVVFAAFGAIVYQAMRAMTE